MAHYSDEAASIVEAVAGLGKDTEPHIAAERIALGQLRLLRIMIAQNQSIIGHIEETNRRLKHLIEQGQNVEQATRTVAGAVEGRSR